MQTQRTATAPPTAQHVVYTKYIAQAGVFALVFLACSWGSQIQQRYCGCGCCRCCGLAVDLVCVSKHRAIDTRILWCYVRFLCVHERERREFLNNERSPKTRDDERKNERHKKSKPARDYKHTCFVQECVVSVFGVSDLCGKRVRMCVCKRLYNMDSCAGCSQSECVRAYYVCLGAFKH